MVGTLILVVYMVVASVISMVAWHLYGKQQTIEHGALLCFAFGQFYSVLTLLAGAFLPLRIVYANPDIVLMLHRSRYLIFDCFALPCVLWSLLGIAQREHAQFGLPRSLFEGSARTVVLIILSLVHAALALPAAQDCGKYPFNPNDCLGVLYYRPARFLKRMHHPWRVVLWTLALFGLLRLILVGQVRLLLATGIMRIAYHGHMTQWDFWRWEIFLQPFATAAFCAALLGASGASVVCDWREFDPTQCLVLTPGGATPLFGSFALPRL